MHRATQQHPLGWWGLLLTNYGCYNIPWHGSHIVYTGSTVLAHQHMLFHHQHFPSRSHMMWRACQALLIQPINRTYHLTSIKLPRFCLTSLLVWSLNFPKYLYKWFALMPRFLYMCNSNGHRPKGATDSDWRSKRLTPVQAHLLTWCWLDGAILTDLTLRPLTIERRHQSHSLFMVLARRYSITHTVLGGLDQRSVS